MTGIVFGLGVMLGAGLAGLLAYVLLGPRLSARIRERDEAREKLDVEAAGARDACSGLDAAKQELAQASLAHARAEGDHREELAKLTSDLESVRREGINQLKLLDDAQETMRAVLKDAAGEAFDGSGKKVVDLAKAAMKEAAAGNRADFERERKNVEQLVTPMKDGLTKLGNVVDKLDRDRERQHAELGEQMRTVVSGQVQVRDEAAVLSRALTQPKAAGDWGEFHLRRLVEQAGMSAHCDFREQTRTEDDGETLRPDLIIDLPGERLVVVDAKTPLAPYREACAATDPEQQDRYLRLFARGVKAHVKKLSSKQYAGRFENAMDFVVMYMPGDQFYGAAIQFEPSLLDDAVKNRVLIATPATFIGLLRTIAYTWQQDQVAETARDIARHGATLYERLATYLTHVDKVSRLINNLAEAQNAAVGSLERSVLPEARRFPELGAVGADKHLPDTRQVDRTARTTQAPEVSRDEQGPSVSEREPDDVEAASEKAA